MSVIERWSPHGPKDKNGDDIIQTPDQIVVHAIGEYIKWTDGGIYHCVDFLEHIDKTSAHLFVLPNGDIVRTRKDEHVAWHAKGFNTNSLGIEVAVPGEHDYGSFRLRIRTDWVTAHALAATVRELLRWRGKYNIPEGRVRRHSDVDPERKIDPGSGFPWKTVLERSNPNRLMA